MKTENETIHEARDTVAYIRKLQEQEANIKESLKEKRSEIEDANDHLTSLFEADSNDNDRPLLNEQDQDQAPNQADQADTDRDRIVTTADGRKITAAQMASEIKEGFGMAGKRPKNASKR